MSKTKQWGENTPEKVLMILSISYVKNNAIDFNNAKDKLSMLITLNYVLLTNIMLMKFYLLLKKIMKKK